MPLNGLDIIVEGQRENSDSKGDDLDSNFDRSIEIADVTKESLSAKPIKYLLKGRQRYLSIGYDLEAGRLTMNYEGVNANKLPSVQKNNKEMCYNKIVDSSINTAGDFTREVQFHLFLDNKRHVITVSYYKRKKFLEFKFLKKKEVLRFSKLTEPGLFPMMLIVDEP